MTETNVEDNFLQLENRKKVSLEKKLQDSYHDSINTRELFYVTVYIAEKYSKD
jgi:hypothetical protein